MKLIIILCTLFLTTNLFAYSMNELEGKYRVSSTQLNIVSILTINNQGSIQIREEKDRFNCSGTSKLVSNKILAKVRCKKIFDRLTFDLSVDMSQIDDLNSFSAPLTFPMIGDTQWHFERLEN